ncbi:MAG TPA: 7TM-DISM domain-containing protein, partial [Chitinophaga sp.]|nr:7TM-DISM domain-containing protein [Chitinophaga sp.]
MFRFLALFLFILPGFLQTQAAAPFVYHKDMPLSRIGKYLEIYTDKTNQLDINQVRGLTFTPSKDNVPNLLITPHTYWVRFTISNQSDLTNLMLEVEYPTIDDITLYEAQQDGTYKTTRLGEFTRYADRPVDHQNYIFPLSIPLNGTREYYLKVRAGEQLQLPIFVGTKEQVSNKNNYRELIFGLYVGLILAMSFYNLFIYLSTKDKSYLSYVSYNL